MKRPRIGAFTLVELLVVIAVISILAAMLLPALEQAMQSAYVATRAGNPRQISMAPHTYEGDFGGVWAPVAKTQESPHQPIYVTH